MIDHSFYQLIHPEDNDKIKDQLVTEETSETRILDLKSMFYTFYTILLFNGKYFNER